MPFKVKGRIENSLGVVAVRPVVGPLSLTLEACGDGVVSDHLLLAALRADSGLPFIRSLMMQYIIMVNSHCLSFCSRLKRTKSGLSSLPSLQCSLVHASALLILFLVVDALFHTAKDLDFIDTTQHAYRGSSP